MLSDARFAGGWQGLRAHDRRFEVPDVLGLEDFASGARREPLPAELFPIPKPSGGVRMLALLDPREHLQYRTMVSAVARRIDAGLSGGVFSDRLPSDRLARRRGTGAGPRGPWLERWPLARRRYRRALRRLVEGRPDTVLVADVRDCFGSIRPALVRRSLIRAGVSPRDASSIGRLLRRFEAEGIPGLPVGPEPSGVLANAVLAPVDRALAEEGGTVLRWVDDWVVGARDQAHGEALRQRLEHELRQRGLEPAPGKGGVIEPHEALARGLSGREPSGPPRAVDAADLLSGIGDPGDAVASLAAVSRLRAFTGRPLGSVEAGAIADIATGHRRPLRVRCWAWRVLAESDPGTVMDAAGALEPDAEPAIGRALVGGVAAVGDRGARALLHRMARRGGDASSTARWALRR